VLSRTKQNIIAIYMGTLIRRRRLTSFVQAAVYGRITPEKSWNFSLSPTRRSERLGYHHGPRTARLPLRRAREVLADLAIGDRIGRKADGGRRPWIIREIRVKWFNPRSGGALQNGSVTSLKGSGKLSIGNPPSDASKDWVVLVKKKGLTPVKQGPTTGASAGVKMPWKE